MEHLSRRAFTFGFVLFTFALLVSSATDDNSKTVNAGNVDSVSKVGETSSDKKTEPETKSNDTTVKKPDAASESAERKNCTESSNDTDCQEDQSFVTRFWDKMANNRDMLFRTMYVLLGVTGIVIIYFIVRAVRWVFNEINYISLRK